MKRVLISLLFLSLFISLSGQAYEFLPKKNYWEPITMDPLAAQSYGTFAAFWQNGELSDFALFGFAFGFQKSFFAWNKSEDKGYDLGLEASAFAQYEWAIIDGGLERNLITSDYIIGIPFVLYFNPWTIRIRFWHISAHLGDDYLLRNGVESYIKHKMKYEQVDVTASYVYKDLRVYFGAGVVIRSNRYRAPLVFNGGLSYKLYLNQKKSVGFYTAFYADSKQALDFYPSVNIGAGLQFGKPEKQPVRLLFTYFYGPLPYSIFEGLDVMWLGLGVYINVF